MYARTPIAIALSLACAALLAACPINNASELDAGVTAPDSGAPLSCASPADCRKQGSDGVCRQGSCVPSVPCSDNEECGLGESCQNGSCRFTGCTEDSDCAAGRCRKDVFACTECASNDQCPASAPVCTDDGHCVKCLSDADCPYPGAPYCEVHSGACVYCLKDAECPNGLTCGSNGVCEGAQKGQSCGGGVSCDLGLTCVRTGSGDAAECLEACSLYSPQCTNGEICVKLTFVDSPSLVFDQGAPMGVCLPPFGGGKGYHETCNDNCQPNLACVSDSSTSKSCKQYCDPLKPFCAAGEKCHPWPGDYSGHEYGLCYPDNGYADPCDSDNQCRAGQACVPRDDPSSFTDLSNACSFAVGSKAGMSACTRDADCASGACRSDLSGAPGTFCFAACEQDSDCSVGGRTGYCDSQFFFTTQYVKPPGQLVKGCRPSCASPNDCAYSPGSTCIATVTSKPPAVHAVCELPTGTKLLGEKCSSSSECREGLCLQQDARGVYRQGVCAHPCVDANDCVPPALADGGTAGTSTQCVNTTVLAGYGPDFVYNTADDLLATAKLCTGDSCTKNGDCSGPYSSCTAQPDPANPIGNLLTVCRAPSVFGPVSGGGNCADDSSCASGVCAERIAGGSKVCLQPCVVGQSDCGSGMTCQAGAVRVKRADGTYQTFDACAP